MQPMSRNRKTAPLRAAPPRILLLTSLYFLIGELRAACRRLELPHLLLELGDREMLLDEFTSRIDEAIASFRPDFVLTVNHLGVDREGVLLSRLKRLKLPLASWFVDNPLLILPVYPPRLQDRTAIFTWDSDNVDDLRSLGFPHVFHLPLAADATRFRPGVPGRQDWRSEVSFVGNSMVTKVARRLEAAAPLPGLRAAYRDLAEAFGASDERSVARFLAAREPSLFREFLAMRSPSRMLAFETLVTWQSTLGYRLGCVKRLLPFSPLIVGDAGWDDLLPAGGSHRRLAELSYYDDLPGFYPLSQVNFNCTSLQMKGAANQRVFDVPASGSFLLTDRRRQMEELFELDSEMAVFEKPEDIPHLLRRWLDDPEGRARVAEAGRRRVLAEHTYDHRMSALVRAMRETFH